MPPAVEVMALIDTGADGSVFDPSVFVPLQPYGLVAGQALYVNAPGLGPVTPVFEYFVSLEFPANVPRNDVDLTCRWVSVRARTGQVITFENASGNTIAQHRMCSWPAHILMQELPLLATPNATA